WTGSEGCGCVPVWARDCAEIISIRNAASVIKAVRVCFISLSLWCFARIPSSFWLGSQHKGELTLVSTGNQSQVGRQLPSFPPSQSFDSRWSRLDSVRCELRLVSTLVRFFLHYLNGVCRSTLTIV